ncbi:MAG TPA: amidohydrolase family protein [Pirellulales bacterium]|nr:amidohydrolase family protein [Pirellulales bacterium]
MYSGRQAYKARYVFPIVSPPLANGVVTVEGGQIVAVGRQAIGCEAIDLGNVAILPGLINPHTHLEFSGLAAPLGEPHISFPDWVRRVVAHRRATPSNAADVAAGLNECRRYGQVAVGEIATAVWEEESLTCSIEATFFWESIGLRHELVDDRLAVARAYLQSTSGSRAWRRGLSPHAPYSVHPRLFDGLISLAAAARAPVAFHLAETAEELRFLSSGDGPYRELLSDLGAWDEAAIPRGTRPFDYLRRLAASGVQALIIHGNYLDEEEIALLAAHADRLTVIYCPRTHAYFGHTRYPLSRLLAAGANVALGTDSRASNPDLDLLEEMRFVARHYADEIPPATLLELCTLRAARALESADRLGSIEPGKTAALATIRLTEADSTDPHRLIYESDRPATPLS